MSVGSRVQPRRELIPRNSAIPLSVAALVVYLSTLSRNFTGGSIEFATEIESGNWSVLLQQHKLLSHPLGWSFLQVWDLFGWHADGLFPLQVLNALAGALAVGFLYRAALRASGSRPGATLVAIGFGLSAGMWLFSTEAAFLTPSLAVTLLALWCLFATPAGDAHRPVHTLRLAMTVSLAVLVYVTNVFLVPTVALFYLLDTRATLRRRTVRIAAFTFGLLVLVSPIYTAALVLVHGVHDPASLRSLGLYGGQGSGVVYGTVGPSNLAYGAYGFLKTLAGFPGLGLDDRTAAFLGAASWPERLGFVAYYTVALIVAAAPILLAFRDRAQLLRQHLQVLAVLSCWGLLNAAFATYWVPKDLRFWVPVALSWWILAAVVLGRYQDHKSFLRRNVAWIPGLLAVFSMVTALGVVLPHTNLSLNRAYAFALSVHDHTNPSDLIISLDGDNYIAYFSQRRTISVLDAVLRAGPDNKDAALAGIDQAVQATLAAGGRVYLCGADPENVMDWDLLAQARITPADVQRFRTRLAWEVDGANVLAIQP